MNNPKGFSLYTKKQAGIDYYSSPIPAGTL
jgi:hypothetical protein